MADQQFGNRHILSNVGDNVVQQLPAGTYQLKSGEPAPGLTVSSTGLVSGTPTTPGVHVMVMEYCCD